MALFSWPASCPGSFLQCLGEKLPRAGHPACRQLVIPSLASVASFSPFKADLSQDEASDMPPRSGHSQSKYYSQDWPCPWPGQPKVTPVPRSPAGLELSIFNDLLSAHYSIHFALPQSQLSSPINKEKNTFKPNLLGQK